MDIMSFAKASSIFGLKSNYTEEELKKKYRELVKKNHPDYHMDAPQKEQDEYDRKTKDINAAYEVLKKNLNRSTTYNYEQASTYWNNQSYQGYGYYKPNYNENIDIERNKIIKEVRSYLKQCSAEKLIQQVGTLIADYILKIQTSTNMRLTITNFKIDLEKLYRNYILIYSKKHNIPSFIIRNNNFNYDCDCAKLFNQLRDCERIVSLDISKIIRKYQYHEHFGVLKNQILAERNKLKEKIYFDIPQSKYLNLLEEYDNKINKLIVDYNGKYRKFKLELDKISKQLEDKVRKYLYTNIKEIVLKSDDDDLAELLISALEESNLTAPSKTENDINESSSSKTSKPREEIFSELRKKYINNSNDSNIDIINKLFITATELLYSENCTIKIASEISKITFENPEEEYERLIKITPNKIRTFDEFLCISKKTETLVSEIHKAKIISYNEINYYRLKNISTDDDIIDEKTFKNNYILIDELLSDAIFLGYTDTPHSFIQVLYYDPKTKKTIIKLPIIETFAISDESNFSNFSFIRNKITDIYQNKAYLKEEISKYFDREYQKKSNTNKNKSK